MKKILFTLVLVSSVNSYSWFFDQKNESKNSACEQKAIALVRGELVKSEENDSQAQAFPLCSYRHALITVDRTRSKGDIIVLVVRKGVGESYMCGGPELDWVRITSGSPSGNCTVTRPNE
jgi:hypothetical protein